MNCPPSKWIKHITDLQVFKNRAGLFFIAIRHPHKKKYHITNKSKFDAWREGNQESPKQERRNKWERINKSKCLL